MSNSDSEDLDEDELLQIALREQSQRDLSYQKGRPLKPVANLIQKPSPSSSSSLPPPLPQQKQPRFSNDSQHQRNPMPKQPPPQQQQRRVMEDDDDSEVELLSISSGDEDSSSKDPRVVAKGRVSKRDEGSWDGGEPDCWKRVDESELGRRVREMREMRAVPVAPKFEHKKSVMVIKGLNTLQSFPRGMECVDPLGLGIIDNKTLRLITDASESSPSKSERDYQDGSLREKLMYFSESFDAKLFLSRVHHDTTAADLEAGALALKTDLKGRTQQKKQLVKENFDCFVSCKTTIDDIESKLRRIEEDPEGAGTHHLFNSIQGVSSLANRAFQPLFERQTQAEKIRSVQGMLQRFRTLFNLPSTIRGSISKGEYDFAVREYRKAKSIELPSHVGILKRVLEEVEKVMHEFKGTLYKSMEDPQIDLTTIFKGGLQRFFPPVSSSTVEVLNDTLYVENTVRLLLELEPESDPVWHYLSIQNQRIRGLLEKCTLDHELRMETLHSEMHERALSEAKWREIQEGSSLSSDVNQNTNMAVDSHLVDLSGEEIDALRGRYIRRLTAVLIHHLPAFWKVALAVFSGKFAKVGDGKYSSHSLDEVAGMIRGTISVYEVKVQNTFRALEESNILCPYMSNTIKEINKACEAFEAKELVPSIAVMALRMLHLEITKVYILRLCSWMRASIEEIPKDESWVPVSILERNKSQYTISFLPLTFHSIMVSAMDQISLMIQSLRSEVKKSEDMFVQFQEIQESVRLASLNCFLDFAGHLERLAGELSQKRLVKGSPQLQNGFYDESEENSSEVPDCVVDPHQRLLIVLSNIGFCKDELSRELYKYKHIWLSSRVKEEEDSDLRDLVLHFSGLEEKVVAQYTFAKSHLIRTAAANYLLDAGFQWGGAPAVKGIRDAAVELLHTLVAVHAEVFAGAKPLLDRTLGILVEALIDTFLSLLHENKTKDLNSLDANGFCQLMLELEYFETILNPYFTPDARESLKSLQGVLLEKATESVTESIETPSHQRRATRGGEELLADDRQQGVTVSPDDLIALAQQYSSELLQGELERTRVNTACFIESIPLDSVPEPAKSAYNSFRGSIDSPSRKHRSTEAVGSPAFYRNRRY